MDHELKSIAAVLVTYKPSEMLFTRLRELTCLGVILLIVDNGSGGATQDRLRAELTSIGGELIANPQNRGLAAALNQGLLRAEQLGFDWVLTLDQDALPANGMLYNLLSTAIDPPNAERVAIVGPRIVEERFPDHEQRFLVPAWWGFRRVQCADRDLHGVIQLITSGSLTNVHHWRALGGFNELLFIEYVDYEYCIRACLAGLELRVAVGALLYHNLGIRARRSIFGIDILPTFHSPVRHYYMMRNRVWMWCHYAWRSPRWALVDLCGSCKSIFNALVLEPGRLKKIYFMCRAIADGILGRMGPIRQ